jgi:hypothetical protein
VEGEAYSKSLAMTCSDDSVERAGPDDGDYLSATLTKALYTPKAESVIRYSRAAGVSKQAAIAKRSIDDLRARVLAENKCGFLMDLLERYDVLTTDAERDILLAQSPLGLAAYCLTTLEGTAVC